MPFLLLSGVTLFAQFPEGWVTAPVLPEQTRRSEMYAFVNANIPELPQFHSLAQWETYRSVTRGRILRLIGIEDVLATHSLKVIQKGVLDRDGYTIEKIDYESYPGVYVPALVWVPKGLTAKAPAMVSISGHVYCDSKAADYVQARNHNLVRRGFIVVSYDYLGCFERAPADACEPGAWGGRYHLNSLFSYTGRTSTGIEVLDGMRAVDYLYSRPDVDRSRIGFTGESGGGNSTYWVSALDDRITLSVPVSAAGALEQWIKADLNYDWHQRPPGLREFADIGTFYAMIAPRPLLVINGRPELAEFDLPSALRSVAYARGIYNLYGKEDRIAFHESSTGHGYQPDKRHELYGWLNRWFFDGHMPHGSDELPYTPEPRDNFRVGLPPGNLIMSAVARLWVDETAKEFHLPQGASQARQWQSDGRRALESLLARSDPGAMPGVVYRYGDDLENAEYKADRLQFEVAADLLIPGVFVRKKGHSKYKTVLFLEKRRGLSAEPRELLERGYALLLLDVRGTGEIDWGGGRTTNWANFVGRPPIGMWTEDVSKVTTYLLRREDVESVAVLGYGLFGKVSLYATALDPRIAAAALTTDSLSYRGEANSGFEHVYADVPRILTWGDTAQLAALVAPRPLAIFAAGLPASLNGEARSYFAPLPRFTAPDAWAGGDELRTNYDWTRHFYSAFGAESRFTTGSRRATLAEAVVRWFDANY